MNEAMNVCIHSIIECDGWDECITKWWIACPMAQYPFNSLKIGMRSILFVFEGGGCNSMNLNALNAFTGWLADWLTGCLADWVTGYLHPWMHWMHWMHRMHWMHWLGDWVTGRLHPWMHRMIDLVNALNGWLGDWVFGLNGWMGQWMHWIGEWVNVWMG